MWILQTWFVWICYWQIMEREKLLTHISTGSNNIQSTKTLISLYNMNSFLRKEMQSSMQLNDNYGVHATIWRNVK